MGIDSLSSIRSNKHIPFTELQIYTPLLSRIEDEQQCEYLQRVGEQAGISIVGAELTMHGGARTKLNYGKPGLENNREVT